MKPPPVPLPNAPTVTEIVADVAQRRRSPVEVVDDYLQRIEATDGELRAYLEVFEEGARADARRAAEAIQRGQPLGPLHGVPIAVKDLIDIDGRRTTCGSAVRANAPVAQSNATCVQRLLDAGAILLGKLHLTEFAGWSHHPTLPSPRNPHGQGRSPGGSSSGSGVAVAAGLTPAALGTDTVASIRNPAAWNGCVGLKPTWGRVSRHGVFPLAASLDHVGPLTTTVDDAALLLSVLAGSDPHDPTSLRQPGTHTPAIGRPLRVGLDRAFAAGLCAPEVLSAVDSAADALAAAGAEIVELSIPMVGGALQPYLDIFMAEVRHAHRGTFPEHADAYGQTFRDLLTLAHEAGDLGDALCEATLFRAAFRDAVDDLFQRVDVLLTPVGPINAPPDGGELRWRPTLVDFLRYTFIWNLTGNPALSLPRGFDAEGMPQAVQLVGARGDEASVLHTGRMLELPRS